MVYVIIIAFIYDSVNLRLNAGKKRGHQYTDVYRRGRFNPFYLAIFSLLLTDILPADCGISNLLASSVVFITNYIFMDVPPFPNFFSIEFLPFGIVDPFNLNQLSIMIK